MTITEMLDKILPYTQEEKRCGVKKATKGRQRLQLAEKIKKYRHHNISDNDILKMLND